MRSFSSKVKSVLKRLNRFSQTFRRSQASITIKSKAEPTAIVNNGDCDWMDFPPAFTFDLTKSISVLYEHYNTFHTIAGGFLDELTFMHNRECNLAATFAADMRKLDNRSLRAGYNFMIMEELTIPLKAITEHQNTVGAKLKRLREPLSPEPLATNRLTNVLDIYDLFVASYQQIESVNGILTRARRSSTQLVPVDVKKTSDFTLRLLFDTCYYGGMVVTEHSLWVRPDTWAVHKLTQRLRDWAASIFDPVYPLPIDELFALDPAGTDLLLHMLGSEFGRILVFVGKQVIFLARIYFPAGFHSRVPERAIHARIRRIRSGKERLINNQTKIKTLEKLEIQYISVNHLLNSTEFLHSACLIWRLDISTQEFLDNKEVQDSIANDILDDEELELLAEARAGCGSDTRDFEKAVNMLYTLEPVVLEQRRKLGEMQLNRRKVAIVPAGGVFNAARWLQKLQKLLDPNDPLPLVELEQSMHEFCHQNLSHTEQEKAAAAITKEVISTLEIKREAVGELLNSKNVLKDKLVLCIYRCSFRVVQLNMSVEDRSLLGSGPRMVGTGQEHASGYPQSEDEEEDPDKVFHQMLALLSEL